MNWVEFTFSVVCGACLTLAVVHFFVWLNQRSQYANLMFSIAAASAAAVAILELGLLHVSSPEQYSSLLRWIHVAIAVFFPCIVGFIWFDLRAGCKWLAVLAVALRVVSLAVNFLSGENSAFIAVTELRTLQGWGIGSFPAPSGSANPLILFGQASTAVGLAFLATVAWETLRGTDVARKRRALVVCGSVALCVLAGVLMMDLLALGQLTIPLSLNLTIVPVVLVMGYLLGNDVLKASVLSREIVVSQMNLRYSEERMRVAMAAADVGLWTWNRQDDAFWFSAIGGRIAGVPDNTELSRDVVCKPVHPDDRDAVWPVGNSAFQQGVAYAFEYRCVLPNGRVRWVAARGGAERGHSQAPLLVRGVLVDITQRRESEQRLREIVDSAPVGMMVCGPDGLILLANLQAHRVFGYARSEMHGCRRDQLIPSGTPADAMSTLAGASEEPTGLAQLHELAGRRKDGTQVAIEVAFAAIYINEVEHVLLSVADISARKLMELENSQQRDELAHLSRVSLLGELSGSLAHELNQPLTAILSNAQAALRFLAHAPPNLAEVQESLAHIVESDKRASEVIRRLRAMLRKEQLDHEALAVNDVIHEVVKLMNSDLLVRKMGVSLDLAAGLPVIVGDRVQLQQVLLNLVINACDAMRDASAERCVRIRSRMVSGPAIEVSISDMGHGIPSDDLERIFSPFVTSKAEGIGLGLAICRTIIDAHRGKLWASNNDGAGATLHFTLPASSQAAVAAGDA